MHEGVSVELLDQYREIIDACRPEFRENVRHAKAMLQKLGEFKAVYLLWMYENHSEQAEIEYGREAKRLAAYQLRTFAALTEPRALFMTMDCWTAQNIEGDDTRASRRPDRKESLIVRLELAHLTATAVTDYQRQGRKIEFGLTRVLWDKPRPDEEVLSCILPVNRFYSEPKLMVG